MRKIKKELKSWLIAVAKAALQSLVMMLLWNYVVVDIIQVVELNFLQAFALLIVSNLLFKNMRKIKIKSKRLKLTGADLITKERKDQLKKHGYTLSYDSALNHSCQLSYAASILAKKHVNIKEDLPVSWDNEIWLKLLQKPHKDRLIIAGALMAAEWDRINN